MSTRKVFSLTEEPTGETYFRLLKLSQAYADTFILVRWEKSAESRQILARLAKQAISSRAQMSWPGTELAYAYMQPRVHYFRFDDAAAEALSSSVNGIYGWREPLPEDLCLLRADGAPWFVSIAHERDCYLVATPEEIARVKAQLPELVITPDDQQTKRAGLEVSEPKPTRPRKR